MTYSPLYIKAYEVGLVQSRQNFILPDDAYPVIENAYVWRERIKRKKAYQLLGRLQRNDISVAGLSLTLNAGQSENLISALSLEANSSITPGSINIVGSTDGTTYTDPSNNGNLLATGGTGTGGRINYSTGLLTITAGGGQNITGTFSYNPNLPVMGITQRERNASLTDETVFFDTVYAYNYNSVLSSFEEFLPGTTWTGTDYNFFWTTNYWVGDGNFKIFWATNNSASDPIRYTNGQTGTNWVDFAPIINAAGDKLLQCLAMLPFRGRMLSFNTVEGLAIPNIRYSNRIRWAAIGNPFTIASAIVTTVSADAWRDDIRGKGGYLDIPTSEDIVSVGFVRDNLVIYCERSTWQLRYTGRTIAPFQIEKVNSELGSASTFSAVQFDTSLVGIGDKGIVECDSFKSERIDIKIPDFVFNLQSKNNAYARIHGTRDFENRLAYWTYCSSNANGVYPDRRLCYNYENDSWSIFTDSLTTLGNFNVPNSRTWLNTHLTWENCPFPWINQPEDSLVIVGGNQQGFIETLDITNTNDPSLYITSITSNDPDATVIESIAHNLQTGQIIKISNIPTGTPFATSLNEKVFFVLKIDADNFSLWVYNTVSKQFSIPQVDSETDYVGGGLISVRDNFNITSKKFNLVEYGTSIMLGYMDILMEATEKSNPGFIAMNVYLDYNDISVSNTLPENTIDNGLSLPYADAFFNAVIPTSSSDLNNKGGTKFWQRVYCSTRGNFITIQFTFNNEQMAGSSQELDVQIDAQTLYIKPAGNLIQI